MVYFRNILCVVLLIFFINFSLAIPDLILENKDPQPKENIYGYISSSEELDSVLNKEDISFYQGRTPISPLEYNLINYNNSYYFNVRFNNEGNYTIRSKEILYQSSGQIKSKIIEKNLSVKYDYDKNQEFSLLEIKPGLIYGYEKKEIFLNNLGTKELEIEYNKQDINLLPGESYKISNYSINQTPSFLEFITYKKFTHPIIYLGELEKETPKGNLRISPEKINIEIALGDKEIKENILQVINNFDNNIQNLSFGHDIDVLEVEYPKNISPRSKEFVTFFINTEKETYVNKNISLSYLEDNNSYSIILPLEITVYPEGTSLENPSDSLKDRLTCEEMQGQFCNTTTHACANDDITFSSEGKPCCLSRCVPFSDDYATSDSNKWVIGLIILIILGIVSYFVYIKYKKTQKNINPNQALKNFTNKIERK